MKNKKGDVRSRDRRRKIKNEESSNQQQLRNKINENKKYRHLERDQNKIKWKEIDLKNEI